jgi:three-Cys-motif partner protein
MAHLSDTAAVWSNPVTLRLINIEKKPSHYKSLCEATAPWVERGIVINKKGSFGDKVTEIIKDIGTKPALFFLDPYGPTKIYFRCLLPILSRGVQATELIINFNAYGLRRLGNLLHTRSRRISEIREEEDQMLDEDTSDNLPLFMSAGVRQSAQAVEDRRILLRDYFEEYLEQHRRTTRGGIRQHIIFKHFGRFHDKDFTKVAQDMVNDGVLVTGHGRKRFNDSEPLTYIPPSTGESKLRRRS